LDVTILVFFPEEAKTEIARKLKILYGNQANSLYKDLEYLFESHTNSSAIHSMVESNEIPVKRKFSKNDIILNTYADSIQGDKVTPLEVLNQFSNEYLKNIINGCHILPFYSWDTDRGFSVLNYYHVDPRNGTWEQFSALKEVFDVLMVDCVLNHASLDNPIVQKALTGNSEFKDFVLIFDERNKPSGEDQLKVTRARPYPVLTQYFVIDTGDKLFSTFNKPDNGEIIRKGWVWTTFSRPNNPDGSVATRQVDLNYQNPRVFLEFIKMILFYISKGTNWIRLDAIGYLWKKIGTNCLHLPETHIFIEILAEMFKYLEPFNTVLISEVNEPQERALHYLGSDTVHKSDMIYLFTHFPLAVHAVLTGSAKYYQEWLPSLKVAKGQLFVSVLGTHDGMGMKPIGNWLPNSEKHEMQRKLMEEYGALANYARLPGGIKIVYELCSTPWNFINRENSSENFELQLNRYLAVFALGLMIKGVPSIYINGLLGIRNNKNALDENRTINREILDEKDINSKLRDEGSHMFRLLHKMLELISIRKRESAFDLKGSFQVISLDESVVSVLLKSSTNSDKIIAMVNVSDSDKSLNVDCSQLGYHGSVLTDLITNKAYNIPLKGKLLGITLSPYQICWFR
jgi:sucrose phosphorylase